MCADGEGGCWAVQLVASEDGANALGAVGVMVPSVVQPKLSQPPQASL